MSDTVLIASRGMLVMLEQLAIERDDYMGDTCKFCGSHKAARGGLRHKPTCPIMKYRKMLGWNRDELEARLKRSVDPDKWKFYRGLADGFQVAILNGLCEHVEEGIEEFEKLYWDDYCEKRDR